MARIHKARRLFLAHLASGAGWALCALVFACPAAAPGQVRDPGVRLGPPGAGAPLPGTDASYFAEARAAFREVHSITGSLEPASGLGSRFNGTSCGGCHAQPAAGGSSPPRNPQFAMATAHGARNKMPVFLESDGPVRVARVRLEPDRTMDGAVLPLFTITGRSDAGNCIVPQPDFGDLNNLTFRIPTPTFGMGLIESIPEAFLLANQEAHAQAKGELGILGRPNAKPDGAIGRFGWKAQHASLLHFSGEAYQVEMGVPNDVFYEKLESLPEICLSLYDAPYDDPTNYTDSYSGRLEASVYLFTNFMRLLDQPKPVASFPGVSAQSVTKGRRVFQDIGCALCHTPTLRTGNFSALPTMNNAEVHLFSDLLLHHMGPKLADGIVQGAAGPDEFRTAPLWGLGQRLFFLHDGRTSDLLEAILEHRSSGNGFVSEANAVVDRFRDLDAAEQQHVLNFLRSL